MSTPTSKKPPPAHASTPSHLVALSSPASANPPRSVPPPIALRKDPTITATRDTPTSSSHHAASTPLGAKGGLGGTPMVGTLSQQTAGALSASPLGGGYGTPLGGAGSGPARGEKGGAGAAATTGSTIGGAATAMVTSISELGLGLSRTASNKARDEDEERWVKMRRVLKSIGRPKGRVGEEGITRVSRRVGFQNDIDAERLTAEERVRRVGNRTISIAGKTVLIDIELKEHVPRAVQVMFSGEEKEKEERGGLAGRVLLGDLEVGKSGLIGSELERFAVDLDRLARLDRLSDKINCFDAVGGVYDTLKRLNEAEQNAVRALRSGGDEEGAEGKTEMEVLRSRSGRPSIHDRGSIGVVQDYWTADPFLDATKAHVTGAAHAADATSGLYSLRIEVEPSPAGLYPPIRVSEEWLPTELELPTLDSGLGIPWQDPMPTYCVPDPTSSDALNSADPNRLPDIRFVAKLDPPIIVPSILAMNIFSALGTSPQEMYSYLPYHFLLLNTPLKTIQSGNITRISSQQPVLVPTTDGTDLDITHHYTLDVAKPEYAYRLTELPFSHPRQIVDLLPTLRQWAHFGHLLRATFADPVYTLSSSTATSSAKDADGEELRIGIALMTSPTPTLTLTYADAERGHVANTVVQVLPNATIGVVDAGDEEDGGAGKEGGEAGEDVAMGDDGEGSAEGKRAARAARMGKALEACADVGVWIEWVRRKA